MFWINKWNDGLVKKKKKTLSRYYSIYKYLVLTMLNRFTTIIILNWLLITTSECGFGWHRSGGVRYHRVCHAHLTNASINPTLWLQLIIVYWNSNRSPEFQLGLPPIWGGPRPICDMIMKSTLRMWEPVYMSTFGHVWIPQLFNEDQTFIVWSIIIYSSVITIHIIPLSSSLQETMFY